MSWFHDNKFLAIFGGSVVVVGGFLGYMVMGASSKYDDAQTHYDETSKKLTSLYGSTPYPVPDNVEALKKRKDEVAKQIASLQEKLAATKIKTEKSESVSQNSFQDKLKETVVKVTNKAGEMDATLPKDFYLGMESYKDKPPQTTYAAAALLKELQAMELVMDILMQSKQVEIKSWTRDDLPEEEKGFSPTPGKKEKGDKGEKEKGEKGERSGKGLIRKESFAIKLVTSQSHFIGVMNNISGHKEQLFVIRNIHVANTSPESPPKVSTQPGAVPVPQPGNTQPGSGPLKPPAPSEGLETVFGQEKVEATLDIDIVDVADLDAQPAAKGNPKSK